MHRPNLMVCVAMVASFTIVAARSEMVEAGDYWNMPGTLMQRTGHGFGGGYHAPLMLGPIRCDVGGSSNVMRLPCAPAPYCGCGSCSDCADCGRMIEAPSSMEGVVPTPAPQAVAQPPRVQAADR